MKKFRSVQLVGMAFLLLLGDGEIRRPCAQTTAPILTVETGMHTAPIRGMAMDAANRYLVTVSNDKTARVWDLTREGDPVLSAVLRPPIDAGKEGIGGKTDFRGTGRITVNMLDLYISDRVKQLTGGEQTPSTVKPPNVPDFPVVVLVK
jgi:WD40 repeat protein